MILFRFSFFFNRILALLDVAMPLEVIGCLKSKKKKKKKLLGMQNANEGFTGKASLSLSW
jgi:hypothetical protein